MLQELKNVAQREQHVFRRWFEDDYFDLIIWYDLDNNVRGFQLCYNKYRDEHAFTWSEQNGFKHDKVDDGSSTHHCPSTPILVDAPPFKWDLVLAKFKKRSETLEKEIIDLVLSKMLEFSNQYSNDVTGDLENAQAKYS